jgi:hypothetical protein
MIRLLIYSFGENEHLFFHRPSEKSMLDTGQKKLYFCSPKAKNARYANHAGQCVVSTRHKKWM